MENVAESSDSRQKKNRSTRPKFKSSEHKYRALFMLYVSCYLIKSSFHYLDVIKFNSNEFIATQKYLLA